MGRVYNQIDEHLRGWIASQPMFFVGSAPVAVDGHVNISPKGPIGTLAVLGPRTVAYLDMVGSGAETIAHLRENGRIVIMFCAFEGPPRILRLHGHGEVLITQDPRFEELNDRFDQSNCAEARRAIVLVEVTRIADACGYGVPLMTYEGHRPHMDLWVTKRLRVHGPDAMTDYQRENNTTSIDGLQAVEL